MRFVSSHPSGGSVLPYVLASCVALRFFFVGLLVLFMPKLSLLGLVCVFVIPLVLFASTALTCVSLQVLGPSVFVSVLPFLAYLIHLVLPFLLARL